MEIKIKDQKINYQITGMGKSVVILHGWGSSKSVFKSLIEFLSATHQVIALDLPGFGESESLKTPWTLDDYVDAVKEFLKELKIKNPTLIGHSFGGRISIKLGSSDDVKLDKIILIDSAGIRRKKSSLKVKLLKILKNTIGRLMPSLVMKMKNKLGSTDYKNANPIMKETLVNVIQEDLEPLLPKVKYSTLLIWGVNDQDTPIEDAYIMESKIKDSGLVKIENAGHYSFLDNPYLTNQVIEIFLGGGK